MENNQKVDVDKLVETFLKTKMFTKATCYTDNGTFYIDGLKALIVGAIKEYQSFQSNAGVNAVDLDWELRYHENDLAKIMKADECRFIGTQIECMQLIIDHYKSNAGEYSLEDMRKAWTNGFVCGAHDEQVDFEDYLQSLTDKPKP